MQMQFAILDNDRTDKDKGSRLVQSGKDVTPRKHRFLMTDMAVLPAKKGRFRRTLFNPFASAVGRMPYAYRERKVNHTSSHPDELTFIRSASSSNIRKRNDWNTKYRSIYKYNMKMELSRMKR